MRRATFVGIAAVPELHNATRPSVATNASVAPNPFCRI
jgi:hypothetical protein